MKKPIINIKSKIALDSKEGREFHDTVVEAAKMYAGACKKAGVEPDDTITILLYHARIVYRSFFIF